MSLLVFCRAKSTVSSDVVKGVRGSRYHGRFIVVTRTGKSTCTLTKCICIHFFNVRPFSYGKKPTRFFMLAFQALKVCEKDVTRVKKGREKGNKKNKLKKKKKKKRSGESRDTVSK